MRRCALAAAATLLFVSSPLFAASRTLTCYLDGGVVSREIVTVRGYAEIPLPASVVPGSLRVKPGHDAVISRVQIAPARVDPKMEKLLASLDERRELLEDRLKALKTREEIFAAAARSQSAKAPRKSKTNPEPVTAIKQGTDLALARLEEVYRLRRTAEKELKGVDSKRVDLGRKANVGGTVARIWLQGSGPVTVVYAQSDAAWKPVYDLRMDGTAFAQLTLRAALPETEPGIVIQVLPVQLAAPGAQPDPLPSAGDYAPVSVHTLPVVVSASAAPLSHLSVTLTNATSLTLPSGDAACFWKGEYRGTTHLPALAPGERTELLCGGVPASPAGR
jgi:hypothetical protein